MLHYIQDTLIAYPLQIPYAYALSIATNDSFACILRGTSIQNFFENAHIVKFFFSCLFWPLVVEETNSWDITIYNLPKEFSWCFQDQII